MTFKNHVIFDFNGVIINDEELHFKATKMVFKSVLDLDLTNREYYEFFVGKTNFSSFLSYLEFKNKKENTEQIIAKKNEIYMDLISKEIPLVQPTIDFIRENHEKYTFSIVTGAIRSEVEFILKKLNLSSVFEIVLCASDFVESKPSPEGYLKAIALSKIPVKNTVIIEDSISGITAAKKAKANCIGLTTTYKREEISHADLIVDELKAEHIEKFFN